MKVCWTPHFPPSKFLVEPHGHSQQTDVMMSLLKLKGGIGMWLVTFSEAQLSENCPEEGAVLSQSDQGWSVSIRFKQNLRL